MARIARDYYKFSRWETGELIEAAGDPMAALSLAIDQARERARIYAIPCEWVAWYENKEGGRLYLPSSRAVTAGYRIVVRRMRYAKVAEES